MFVSGFLLLSFFVGALRFDVIDGLTVFPGFEGFDIA